jgi:hypothetical protein
LILPTSYRGRPSTVGSMMFGPAERAQAASGVAGDVGAERRVVADHENATAGRERVRLERRDGGLHRQRKSGEGVPGQQFPRAASWQGHAAQRPL